MRDIHIKSRTDAEAIQNIIDGAEHGTTIHLAAGTYVMDQTLVIDRSGVSLVGAGSSNTTIIASPSLGTAPAVQLGHALHHQQVIASYSLAATAREGATAVRLEPDHGTQVGDFLYFTQENTTAFFAEIGDGNWRQEKNLRTILVEVTSVNGNRVEFDTKLPFQFDPAITKVERREIIEDNALGGFTLKGGWGRSDPSDFSNTEWSAVGSTMLMVGGTSDATLTDISVQDAASHGITVGDSTNLEMDRISVDGALNKGSSGNGYGLWVRDVYGSTFENLEIADTRHAVVFASYTSAIGNSLHVTETNRDINFHGGRDQNNIVVVDSSIRAGEEARYLAPTVFFNEGTNYGAPTEQRTNDVTFKSVAGTVREETVTASDAGAVLQLRGGSDTAITGLGDDFVNLGAGDDTVYGSIGMDTFIGGAGEDTVKFEFGIGAYATSWNGEILTVATDFSMTRLTEFERVSFGTRTVEFSEVRPTSLEYRGSWDEIGGAGLGAVAGSVGWERAWTWVSSQMGEQLNAMGVRGAGDIHVFGNDTGNHVLGSAGANRIEGAGGNDRLVGMLGDDVLLGGDGDDSLVGGIGNDTLVGGSGNNELIGGSGADTFVATQGRNIVRDFNYGEGDEFVFNGDMANSFEPVLEAYREGTYSGTAFDFAPIRVENLASLEITALNGESLTLLGVSWDDLF